MAGHSSFMFGTSITNQIIECWWSMFKKQRSVWWTNFFKDLVDSDEFNPSFQYQIECARFCFLPLIQAELDETLTLWNNHRIRKVHNSDSPAGRPDVLYSIPHLSGGSECGLAVYQVDIVDIDIDILPCLHEMNELCKRLILQVGFSFPINSLIAKWLFLFLIREFENLF